MSRCAAFPSVGVPAVRSKSGSPNHSTIPKKLWSTAVISFRSSTLTDLRTVVQSYHICYLWLLDPLTLNDIELSMCVLLWREHLGRKNPRRSTADASNSLDGIQLKHAVGVYTSFTKPVGALTWLGVLSIWITVNQRKSYLRLDLRSVFWGVRAFGAWSLFLFHPQGWATRPEMKEDDCCLVWKHKFHLQK